MGLLQHESQRVEIKLYYKEVKKKNGFSKIVILDDNDQEVKDFLEDNKEKERDVAPELENDNQEPNQNNIISKKSDVECLTTTWKVLTWKDQNNITQKSTYYNMDQGIQDLDIWKYRDLRLKECLVDWNLTDDNGNKIPVNSMAIDALPSDVVVALLNKYDAMVTLSEEEEKN